MSSTRRERLTQTLHTDEDLNAFCIDHFPEVYGRFTGGMDRLAKQNLLLHLTSPSELDRCLDEYAQRRGQIAQVDRESQSEQTMHSAGITIAPAAQISGTLNTYITLVQPVPENDDFLIRNRISGSIKDDLCKKTLATIDPRQHFTALNVSIHLDKFLSEKIRSAKEILFLIEVVQKRMEKWFPGEQSLSRSYMPQAGTAIFLWQKSIAQSIDIGIRATFALLLCAQDYIGEPLPFLHDLIDKARKIGDAP